MMYFNLRNDACQLSLTHDKKEVVFQFDLKFNRKAKIGDRSNLFLRYNEICVLIVTKL